MGFPVACWQSCGLRQPADLTAAISASYLLHVRASRLPHLARCSCATPLSTGGPTGPAWRGRRSGLPWRLKLR